MTTPEPYSELTFDRARAPTAPDRTVRRAARRTLLTAAEKLLTWTVVPQLRVALLRGLGARIGRDVRIYEVRFINVADGFGHLVIGDHVHIGPGTMIDLTRRVRIGTHTVIAPHCILHTHTDAGEVLGSPMARRLPTVRAPVELGRACYLGARSTVLAGVTLGDLTAVAAGSVVTRSTEGHELVGGTPAHRLRRFDVTD